MAIHLEQRASRWLSLLLAVTVLAVMLFGALFVALGDWVAGVFALVAVIGVARLVILKVRLVRSRRAGARARDDSVEAARAPTGAPWGGGGPFVSRASYNIGARSREGYVVISQQTAGFVPTGEWRHLALDLASALVGSRVPLTHSELEAVDAPSLADELGALVSQRDGVMMDSRWVWVLRGRWLARPEGKHILRIADRLPDALSALWTDAPATSAAHQRRVRNGILAGGGAVVAVLAGAGVTAWRFTGDSDFLTAGLSFAGLIAVSVVVGVIAGERLKAGAGKRQ